MRMSTPLDRRLMGSSELRSLVDYFMADEGIELNILSAVFFNKNNKIYSIKISGRTIHPDLRVNYDYLEELIPILSKFDELTELGIANYTDRVLPSSLGSLQHITNLYINESYNLFQEGSTDRSAKNLQSITFPKAVKHLAMGSNQITLRTLPGSIQDLDLTHLSLTGNRITTLPHWISKLTNLEEIWMRGNKIENMDELAPLKKLRVIQLGINKIQEIPAFIENLSSLEILELEENKLREIPTGLTKLTKLRQLRLNNNYISKIPHDLVLRADGLLDLEALIETNNFSSDEKNKISALLRIVPESTSGSI